MIPIPGQYLNMIVYLVTFAVVFPFAWPSIKILFGDYIDQNEFYFTVTNIQPSLQSVKKPEDVITKFFTSADSKNLNYCKSDVCKRTAELTINHMKPSVKPCDNFYDFICGNYHKSNFTKSLINEKSKPDPKLPIKLLREVTDKNPHYQRKVRKFMDLCIAADVTQSDKENLKSIMNKLGGWPILLGKNQWDNQKFNLTRTLTKLRRWGFQSDYLFDVTIGIHPEDETRRIIRIDGPSLTMFNSFYTDEEYEETFVNYSDFMYNFTSIFGASNHKQDIIDVHKLELEIADFFKVEEDDMLQLLTIRELQSKYPFIDWLAYINDILYPEVSVRPREIVYVADLSYLKELNKLMMDKSRRPSNRTLANYIFWRVFWESAMYLDIHLRNVYKLYSTLDDPNYDNRVKECYQLITTSMDFAVSGMFVESVFGNRTLEPLTVIGENIRDSLLWVIQEVPWMDVRTKKSATKKALQIGINIGYSKEIFNKFYLNKFYQNFVVDEQSFLKTVLNYKRFNFRNQVKTLKQHTDKNDWQNSMKHFMSGIPFYISLNAVFVPASSISEFLYHEDYPSYINYARLGHSIGHEMIHAFDTSKRFFDGNGYDTDWWSDWSSDEYLKKTQCISEQYGNFKFDIPPVGHQLYEVYKYIDKPFIISNKTINENLADIGGTKIAYLAYTSWLEKNPEKELHLEKFSTFTPKQMFWISYTSMWCDIKYSQDILRQHLENDHYPPDKFRAIGTLINLPEFSQDFKCRPDDPMNQMKKCDMWWSSDNNKFKW